MGGIFRIVAAAAAMSSILAGTAYAAPDDAPMLTDIVFRRNVMLFTGDRISGGASSSLIEIDGKVYLLTAKHLLGKDMGIEPEVKPSNFDRELEVWKVLTAKDFDAGNFDAGLFVTGIHRPDDDMNVDLMVLEVDVRADLVAANTLPLSKDRPEPGDRLFIIGCPYSESGQCDQNIYGGTLVPESYEGMLIIELDDGPSVLSGFSGAATLNSNGEIIGVIYGGSDGIALATPLPEWMLAHGE